MNMNKIILAFCAVSTICANSADAKAVKKKSRIVRLNKIKKNQLKKWVALYIAAQKERALLRKIRPSKRRLDQNIALKSDNEIINFSKKNLHKGYTWINKKYTKNKYKRVKITTYHFASIFHSNDTYSYIMELTHKKSDKIKLARIIRTKNNYITYSNAKVKTLDATIESLNKQLADALANVGGSAVTKAYALAA